MMNKTPRLRCKVLECFRIQSNGISLSLSSSSSFPKAIKFLGRSKVFWFSYYSLYFNKATVLKTFLWKEFFYLIKTSVFCITFKDSYLWNRLQIHSFGKHTNTENYSQELSSIVRRSKLLQFKLQFPTFRNFILGIFALDDACRQKLIVICIINLYSLWHWHKQT